METIGARFKKRCAAITLYISLVYVDTIGLMCASKTDFSYNYSAQVKMLCVGCIVGAVAVLPNFVCLGYVSAKQDEDDCCGI